MRKRYAPKNVLGLLAVLALAMTITTGIVGTAKAVGCTDPPCGTCRNGTWDPRGWTCCGSSWDCANCTVCAN